MVNCKLCDFAAPTLKKLWDHELKIHDKSRYYKCHLCWKSYTCKPHLNEHIKVFHKKILDFKCQICGLAFIRAQKLERHIKSVHEKTQSEFDSSELSSNSATEKTDLKMVCCKLCAFSAKTLKKLWDHELESHGKPRDFNCNICGNSYTTKGQLKDHIKTVHENVRKFKCPRCDFAGGGSKQLRIHIKSVHDKIKDLSCTECSFSTSVKSNLIKHWNMKHCNVSSSEETNANIKEEPMDESEPTKSNEKQFSCHKCSFSTMYAKSLWRHHKYVHDKVRDFQCRHCSYAATSQAHLNRHKKMIHDKINDFECPQCDHTTSCKESLKRHIRLVHGSVTSFKCFNCRFSSANETALLLHVKEAHNNNEGQNDSQSQMNLQTDYINSSVQPKANSVTKQRPVRANKAPVRYREDSPNFVEIDDEDHLSQEDSEEAVTDPLITINNKEKIYLNKINQSRNLTMDKKHVQPINQPDVLEEKKTNLILQIETIKAQISDIISKNGSQTSLKLKLTRAETWVKEYKEIHDQHLPLLSSSAKSEQTVKYVNLLGLWDDIQAEAMDYRASISGAVEESEWQPIIANTQGTAKQMEEGNDEVIIDCFDGSSYIDPDDLMESDVELEDDDLDIDEVKFSQLF